MKTIKELKHANIDFILVNYFSEDLAKIAVESIYKFTKSPFNILLIDNSKDKSLLKNKFKNFNKDNFYLIDGYNQETPEERFEKGKNTEWYKQSTALLGNQVLAKDPLGGNWLSQIYRQTIKGEWL